MQDVSFDRLSSCTPGLIFPFVRKEMTRERQTNMKDFKYPSTEELYALDQRAHRARSEAIARLLVSGAKALKAFVARAIAPSAHPARKQVVHHA